MIINKLFFFGKYFLLVVLLMNGSYLWAETRQNAIISLLNAGFRNVRYVNKEDMLVVALENKVYRWNVTGIVTALDSLASDTTYSGTVHLVLLDRDIPQVLVSTSLSEWKSFREGKISRVQYERLIQITYNVDRYWSLLSEEQKYNSGFGYTDLVFYNELKVVNNFYDRLYDTQINFAPAIELYLWKGSLVTIQWLFPLTSQKRSFGPLGNQVRPGFVTFNQEFRFIPHLYTNFSAGVFNRERSGIAMQNAYFLNEHISFTGDIAYTGYNGSYGGNWEFGVLDKLTWSGGANYFLTDWNTQLGVSVQELLTDQVAARVDVTRMFGEVSIGFYAMLSKGEKEGGFNFSIPLPGKKRPGFGHFRMMLPRYFDWEYETSSDFKNATSFEVRPNENRIEFLFNPAYLKTQILDY